MKTAYFLSDIHYPYHDKDLFQTVLDIAESVNPDYLIFGGDLVDLPQVSRFSGNSYRMSLVLDDVQGAVSEVLAPLVEVVKDKARRGKRKSPEIVFLEGNHEDRLHQHQHKVSDPLSGYLEPEEYLQLKEIIDQGNYYRYQIPFSPAPGLTFVHGHRARKWAGMSAYYQLSYYQGHLIVGHSHRLAQGYHKTAQGNYVAIEAGHLTNTSEVPGNSRSQDWKQSAGVIIRFSEDGSVVVPQLLPVTGEKLDKVFVDKMEFQIDRSSALSE